LVKGESGVEHNCGTRGGIGERSAEGKLEQKLKGGDETGGARDVKEDSVRECWRGRRGRGEGRRVDDGGENKRKRKGRGGGREIRWVEKEGEGGVVQLKGGLDELRGSCSLNGPKKFSTYRTERQHYA